MSDRAWRAYAQQYQREILERLQDTAVMVGVWDAKAEIDATRLQFATSLGLMLSWDRPLVLCVEPGARLPERLARAADAVIFDFDPGQAAKQDELAAAIRVAQERTAR